MNIGKTFLTHISVSWDATAISMSFMENTEDNMTRLERNKFNESHPSQSIVIDELCTINKKVKDPYEQLQCLIDSLIYWGQQTDGR